MINNVNNAYANVPKKQLQNNPAPKTNPQNNDNTVVKKDDKGDANNVNKLLQETGGTEGNGDKTQDGVLQQILQLLQQLIQQLGGGGKDGAGELDGADGNLKKDAGDTNAQPNDPGATNKTNGDEKGQEDENNKKLAINFLT